MRLGPAGTLSLAGQPASAITGFEVFGDGQGGTAFIAFTPGQDQLILSGLVALFATPCRPLSFLDTHLTVDPGTTVLDATVPGGAASSIRFTAIADAPAAADLVFA